MSIRIALLVFGALMAGGSSATQAVAMKPLDPDQAPPANDPGEPYRFGSRIVKAPIS